MSKCLSLGPPGLRGVGIHALAVDELEDRPLVVVRFAGDGGRLLVDCGEAAHAQDLLALTGGIKTVVNTHWHLESTGANDAMAKAGAKLASHVNTELWMTQEITPAACAGSLRPSRSRLHVARGASSGSPRTCARRRRSR